MLARTDIGLYRRVQAKTTAFSLIRYISDMMGWEPKDIARYAV
jgi:hypothetical protein